MTGATRDIDRGWKRLKRDLWRMRGAGVKVGIQSGGQKNEGVEVVDYAIFNEFGTEHIPARPFMRCTADEQGKKAGDVAVRVAAQVIAGRFTVPQALGRIGAWYQAAIQNTIRDARSWADPNSPSTIAMKKGSTSPLVDHGVLVGAVRYELER